MKNPVMKYFMLIVFLVNYSKNVISQNYSLNDVEFTARWINWIDLSSQPNKFNVSDFNVEVQIHQNINVRGGSKFDDIRYSQLFSCRFPGI